MPHCCLREPWHTAYPPCGPAQPPPQPHAPAPALPACLLCPNATSSLVASPWARSTDSCPGLTFHVVNSPKALQLLSEKLMNDKWQESNHSYSSVHSYLSNDVRVSQSSENYEASEDIKCLTSSTERWGKRGSEILVDFLETILCQWKN